MIQISDNSKSIITVVIAFIIIFLVYVRFFQPLPDEIGFTKEQQEEQIKKQEELTGKIEDLIEEATKASSRAELYRRRSVEMEKKLEELIRSTPSHPSDINLSDLSFDEKVELFNGLVNATR